MRFYILYDEVWRADILRHAYAVARAKDSAPEWKESRSSRSKRRGWRTLRSNRRNELRRATASSTRTEAYFVPGLLKLGQFRDSLAFR